MALPSGTLTFLFTDVEGSTRLWERDAARMRAAIAEHDRVLTASVSRNSGFLFKKVGDAVCAVFSNASDAVAAALEGQTALQNLSPDSVVPVRMALYTGFAQPSEGDYLGPALNRTSRVLGTAHGGQVLVSQATRDLVLDSLPRGASLIDLGSHNLKDLERSERIYQLAHTDIPHEFPPIRSLAAFRHNLPVHLTSLIGRGAEKLIVEALLSDHRLVTLYGSGGCGKTRLALQVGAEVIERFPDGVWVVELINAADSAQAEHAMVAALGLREESGVDMRQVLIDHLRDRIALLIVDNCEHLVESSARQGEALLKACPHIKVLATSREVLGIPGEVTYRVPSLPIPSVTADITPDRLREITSADSVRLFYERASEAMPGFAITSANAAAIAAIVQRLDGIPLAIELAAARIKTLNPDQISERLRDHFSLLARTRGGPSRHATLRATMDWSYGLLDDREKALLARLSVFSGGWDLEAAEAVCAAGIRGRSVPEPFESDHIVEILTRLEEKSLIIADWQAETTRFRMLQMVREYATECLNETDSEALGGRHLEYFVGLAVEAEANISGPNQADWLKRLDREHDNLRAALEHAKRNAEHSESGLLLAGSLARYWHIRGFLSEGRRQLQSIIGLSDRSAQTRGAGLARNGAGILAWAQGDFDSAQTHYEQAREVWTQQGDDFRLAATLNNMGLLAVETEDFPSAKEHFDASLEIRRRIGDEVGIATSLSNLALCATRQNDFATSIAYNEASLELERKLGNELGVAISLMNLGVTSREAGKLKEARNYYGECLAILERIGDRAHRAYTLMNLGELANEEDQSDEAAKWYRESLLEFERLGDPRGMRLVTEKSKELKPPNIPDSASLGGFNTPLNEAN